MLHMRTTLIAVEGLIGIAEKTNRSIPQVAIEAIRDIRENGCEDGLVSSQDVIGAAISLDPGATYTEGLLSISGANDAIRKAGQSQIQDCRKNKQEEHIEPIEKASRYLTGRKP